MKVVCIDDCTLSGKKITGLTLGKIYDVNLNEFIEYKILPYG